MPKEYFTMVQAINRSVFCMVNTGEIKKTQQTENIQTCELYNLFLEKAI